MKVNTTLTNLDLRCAQQQDSASQRHGRNKNKQSRERDNRRWNKLPERGIEGKHFTHFTELGKCVETRLLKTTIRHQPRQKGNKISADGARALGEALKVNTTLTNLDLRCAQQQDSAIQRHGRNKNKQSREQDNRRWNKLIERGVEGKHFTHSTFSLTS